jgi:NAD(P)-dependent dehydrogenase (short-subunit alcohol dehydrogenase family)
MGYSPSKGAVKLMTQALAVELAKEGVRVNSLAPGVMATPMTEVTRSTPEKLDKFMLRTPMARVGQAEELIGPVVFLASGDGLLCDGCHAASGRGIFGVVDD